MPDSVTTKAKLLSDYQKELKSINKDITTLAVKSNRFHQKKIQGQSALKKRIAQGGWKNLKSISKINWKDAETLLNDLIKTTGNRNTVLSARTDVFKSLKPYLAGIRKNPGWPALKTKVEDQLKKKGHSKAVRSKLIKDFESFNVQKGYAFSKKIDATYDKIIKDTFLQFLSAYIYHYYNYICALTNLGKADNKKFPGLKTSLTAIEKRVEDRLKLFKDTAKSTGSSFNKQLKDLETATRNELEDSLLPLSVSLYTAKIKKRADFNTGMSLSLQAGTAIRKSLLLLAAIKRLRFDHANQARSADFNKWKQNASLPSGAAGSDAKKVSLSSLVNDGRNLNNKMVTIKGRVLKVKIRHVNRKVISYAFIGDGNATVRATIPYIKVDSSGMAPGSYVEITGRWLQKNKESFDKPALNIDQVDNKTAAKTSWLSWLTLTMNDVFPYVPHSINARLSWKPGRNGSINPTKFALI